jgi:osmotically-inducible protein OsmY
MSLRVTGIVVSSLGIAVLLAACSANPLSVPVGVVTTVAEDRPVSDAGSDLRIKTEILKGFAEEAKGLLVDASVYVYQGQVLLTGSVKKAKGGTKAKPKTWCVE